MSALEIEVVVVLTIALGAFVLHLIARAGESSGGASANPVDRAQKKLAAAGTIMQSLFGMGAVAKFLARLGWFGPSGKGVVFALIAVPFLVSAVAYIKVQRDVKKVAVGQRREGRRALPR